MRLVHLSLLLVVVFWGWSFVATKVLLEHLTPAEVLGGRLLLGVPVLGALMLATGARARLTGSEWGRVTLGATVLLGHFLIQITGLKYTSATNTGWIIAVTPLAIVLLSLLILREPLTGWQGLGIAVATGGILLLVSRGNFGRLEWLASVGDWLALASTFTWAIYTVLSRDLARARDPLVVITLMLSLTGLASVVLVSLVSDWRVFLRLPREGVVALLFLGLLCTALGFWFWQQGVARLGAARAGFFLYLEPLATTVLAVPYLGEPFTLATAVGGGLVLVGVWLAEKRKGSET